MSRDITKFRSFHLRTLQGGCKNFNEGVCRKSKCDCDTVAEVRGYINAIIPRDCQNLTLHDFTGVAPGQAGGLDGEVVLEAKRRVVRYCWGKLPAGMDPTSVAAMKHSAISERRAEGVNVVIHGDPFQSSIQNNQVRVASRKLGRSLIASLIMKEVIQRRFFDGHGADRYEWVQYKTLTSRLMQDRDEVSEYQTCDWLVIDNIFEDRQLTANQRAFAQSMLDSVLLERLDQRLPTILVFHLNVESQGDNLHSMFGAAMAQIVEADNTLKINLSKRDR